MSCQLIWIFTVCKGRVYPGSAGQGLNIAVCVANNVDTDQTPHSVPILRAITVLILNRDDDDDEFRFNDASTHEGHLRQNGELTWFCSETIIMISHKCIKCKTRTI